MDCNETRRHLEASLDGELDLMRQLEVETHLRSCAECTQIANRLRERREVRRASLPRFQAPPSLTKKIRDDTRTEPRPAVLPKKWRPSASHWSALAASIAVA